MEVCELYSYH